MEEVRQSVAAMESVQPEAPVAEPAEVVEASASEEPKWNYQVGDTVYLDDTAFRVEQITDREVQLRDPTLAYPIFRAENRENFERMLSQDERNHAVRVDAQTEEKPVTEDFLGKTEPRDYTPEYQLLDRLRMDCEYFLGAGQHSEKHLWAGNRHAQIAKMRELYEMIPDKPEWLTPEMINSYEERMAPRYLVAAYHHFENGFDDKLDYYTLEEAEKAAQGYVDGTMEDDGFKYDGAAVYDQQEHKCIRIYGDYPDEKAHAQVRASAEPEQQEPEHFIDHFYVAEDIQKRGALDIKELIYLENFAPDEARERFEERIRSLFETKWIIELVDMAMLKIREYPDKGALYCEIISKAYLNRFKYRESEMLEVLNMERSTYYDRKKEAILLFGLSLWGTAIPKLKDFLESAREEEALCYCEC